MRYRQLLLGFTACMLYATSALAEPIEADQILRGDTPPGAAGPAGDAFGASLAEWKDWVAVGAARETSERIDPLFGSPLEDGAVYLYERRGKGELVLRQTLEAPGQSTSLGDRFGAGVLVDGGNLFVVSANGGDFTGFTDPAPAFGVPFAFAGAVDVYRLDRRTNEWTWQQQLISPSPRTGGSFGGRSQSRHVAISPTGQMLVIAEPQLFPGADPQLHVYTRRGRNGDFELTQSVVLEASTPDTQVLSGDSVVALGSRHFALSVNRVRRDETGAPVSVSTSLQVFERRGRFLEIEPVQTIEGETIGAFDCDPVSADITGLAAGGRRLSFAQPCALGGTGRVDIYRLGGNGGEGDGPLELEASISGDVPGGRFGASLFGGQESLAFDRTGKRLAVGTSGAVSDPLGPGSRNRASVWERSGRGDWEKVVDLAPTSPDALLGGFGTQVLILDDERVLSATADADPSPVSGAGEVGIYALPKGKR